MIKKFYVITRYGRTGGYVPKAKLLKLKEMLPNDLKKGRFEMVSDARLSVPSRLKKLVKKNDVIILITNKKISAVPLDGMALRELVKALNEANDQQVTTYEVIYKMLNQGS